MSISIHALLAESDLPTFPIGTISSKFLSTLSLRRATAVEIVIIVVHALISIHALLAESDYFVRGQRLSWGISIHALLAESDHMGVTVLGIQHNFYPRSPCGERRRK